jgi:hypothetical protein
MIPLLLFATLTPQMRDAIDRITAAKGAYTEQEDVHRVAFPRNDVKVTVDGAAMHPFLGLTSWAAFQGMPYTDTSSIPPRLTTGVMVMGDLVLFEDEVNPAMSEALDNGLEVTALHNHFFFDNPRVYFMHIGGMGETERIASAVKRTLDKVKEIRAAHATPQRGFPGPAPTAASSIDAGAIDLVLGVKGQTNAGMYKMTMARKAKMHGRVFSNQMGLNTWAAFSGSPEAAFVDGDFAMHPLEVQPVIRALRAKGINIVAIHNHMTEEEPHYVFLHYWGKGRAVDLAKALKSALDEQARYFSMTNQ